MKRFLLIAFLFTILGCTSLGNEEMIQNLNGYWNIERVEKPDGSEKEFPFTNHMDYFVTSGNAGSKTRVSPTYDGGFISYGDAVPFTWKANENQLVLNFAEGDGSYTQILRKASTEELELVHEDGTVYFYTRYQSNAK